MSEPLERGAPGHRRYLCPYCRAAFASTVCRRKLDGDFGGDFGLFRAAAYVAGVRLLQESSSAGLIAEPNCNAAENGCFPGRVVADQDRPWWVVAAEIELQLDKLKAPHVLQSHAIDEQHWRLGPSRRGYAHASYAGRAVRRRSLALAISATQFR